MDAAGAVGRPRRRGRGRSRRWGALEEATTTHLDHEEALTEPLLRRARRHPALKEMGKQFAGAPSSGVAGDFFAWMQDGAAPEETGRAARAASPARCVAIIGGLFGRRYRKEVAPVWAGSAAALTSRR